MISLFFKDMANKIHLGAAYYPELWEDGEVEKDVARCKLLGIDTLRVGEFAWSRMEPRDGEYDLDWLKRVVDTLYANGIYTVMCTPTCTPPRRLLDKYEQLRAVGQDGRRADVSSRCHTCKTSKLMRRKNAAIVTEMAKVFAGHSGVIGWQIDNEIYPYGEGCYCEDCKSAFRKYLEAKYGSIQAVNKKWGMARWSLEYESFDAVQPPYAYQWRHPSLRKAWWDFQCAQIKSYVDEQAEILHKYGCKNVGTDMMENNYLGYYDINRNLDTVQFNHYNVAADLPYTAFSYDFLRCVKDKPFWVTETQVGWNGSEYADSGARPVGNCYANTWLPIAHGAEMNLYWLFRAHPNGHELAHGALFSTSGRSYLVSDEVRCAQADIGRCEVFLTKSRVKSSIALHYSSETLNSLTSAPIVKGLDYRRILVQSYHSAFRHYNTDVIDTSHSLSGYDVVLSPFLAVIDAELKERITAFVNGGGTWIVGPMSDIMDGDVNKYTEAPYGFLEELAGVYTKYQKPVNNANFKAQYIGDGDCEISFCYDAYEPAGGTKTIAAYVDCEFAPYAVITERKVGKGKVILVGSVVGKSDLLRLVDKLPIAEASANVILTERTGEQNGIIAVETENKLGYIVLDGEYRDIISGRVLSGRTNIAPYEVLVLIKNRER